MPKYFFVECRIRQGGFSQERVFEIDLPDGNKLVGTANVAFLRDEQREPLEEGVPSYDEEIPGFVQCRKIQETVSDEALVEFPSSDVRMVKADQLQSL